MKEEKGIPMQKGESIRYNGDMWMVVDVAPAHELAEMVAVMLEEEGYIVQLHGGGPLNDALSSLGANSFGYAYVLVPEAQGPDALAFISENVEDFEGEDAQVLLEQMALEAGGGQH